MNTINHEYAVKGVKSFIGREGYGYSCSLYKGTKRIATVTDTASGGPLTIHWNDLLARNQLQDFTETLPLEKFDDFEFQPNIETFIGSLVDEYENAKHLKKLLKTNWVYRFKNKENLITFRKCKTNKIIIEMQYADQIVECLNK